MSYIAYINGFEVELSDIKPIALTKQVNDIARLDNRQTNFSNKITLPFTAKNIRAMQNLFLVGNTSNVPYKKNRFDLIDAKSGKHLVYNGWCNVGQTTTKGYEINTYDGIIDFYRAIENKSLTDVNISELNHVKDLTTIVDSWTNDLAYKYILADYNGKVYTDDSFLNADYLIPSAKVSYIFDKIHSFAGFTYEGSFLTNDRFFNFYMTFPKPIPTTEPIVSLISTQTSNFLVNGGFFPGLGGAFFSYSVNFFPSLFSTADANITTANIINISTTGAYRLTSNGLLTFPSGLEVKDVEYTLRAPDNTIKLIGTIDASIGQNVFINAEAGDRIFLSTALSSAYFELWSGTFDTTFELILGYSANFDYALVDFKATDFINEIMQHFALTAFKDKYTNHIEYLTLEEILQNQNVIDWSDKFVSKNSERYVYSTFAKKNNFVYKYNDGNLKYNDSAIFVNNENLKDETNVVISKFYTPEQNPSRVLVNDSNVYKFWDKEVKDDLSVNYKPLSGRYYSLRYIDYDFLSTQTLKSEELGTSTTFTIAPIESYFRLKQQDIIYDNYITIGSILDNARILDTTFYLSPLDYESFDFKSLIYVRQLSSYYQVNKINNFIPNIPTKVELIEVDYFNELELPEPTNYFIQINNDVPVDYVGCVATFTLFADLPLDADVEIVPYALTPDGIGGFYYAPYPLDTPIIVPFSSTLSYEFTQLPEMPFGGYRFKFIHRINVFQIVESELSNIINISGACYFPIVPTADLSYITITDVETISIVNGMRNVRVTYESDLSVTFMGLTLTATSTTNILPPYTQDYLLQSQNGFVDISLPNNTIGGGGIAFYELFLTNFTFNVTSNIATS